MARAKGTSRYGEVKRFDQKNTIYTRTKWDPSMAEIGLNWYADHTFGDRPGYTLQDWALAMGAWNLERRYGHASLAGDYALTQWHMPEEEIRSVSRLAPGQKYEVSDPAQMSRDIKKVTQFLGACLVGICRTDQRWVYSHRYNRVTAEYEAIEVPPEYEYAVVYAVEMDYEVTRTSPAYNAAAAAGLAYSEMVYVSGLLAHFIRTMGYKAIPCGNDTALSVPMAVDSGLGEVGRHGMLITEKFGPRIRLGKVFTDLPLVPDEPIEFGAEKFCHSCKRCAEECPGRAITSGEPNDRPHNISNNGGVVKWYVNAEQCFGFWSRNQGGVCAVCVRVCPFNKLPGRLHDSARFLAKSTPWLDPLLVRMDKFLGYGKRMKVEDYWGWAQR